MMYACTNCDTQYLKWQGRCNECSQWGTLKESAHLESSPRPRASDASTRSPFELTRLDQIKISVDNRFQCGLPQVDQLLGGGVVPGSLILLAGEPGIGKSTFVLQLVLALKPPGFQARPNSDAHPARSTDKPAETIYAACEESPEQIKTRLDRLGPNELGPGKGGDIAFLRQPTLEQLLSALEQIKPSLAIIDSIQTIASSQIDSPPGSLTQVRACTSRLLEICKKISTTALIIGQVTKDGLVAGPKSLEHLVDTVLYLEGDNTHDYRLLRVTKNRFGQTDDVMVMKMAENGLQVVANPSLIFMGESPRQNQQGCVITPIIDGSKTFLLEIQALVTPTNSDYPQRRSAGFDNNRLQLLLAVLIKQAGLNQLNSQDVHLNVVGGYNITEPSADLAVCLAVTSSVLNKKFDQTVAAFGEVGLTGEIRNVKKAESRIKELQKLGVAKVLGPHNVKSLTQALEAL